MPPILPQLPPLEHVAQRISDWQSRPDFALLMHSAGDPAVALYRFASACWKQRDYDTAIEALLAALALLPAEARLWRELASVYQMAGRDALAEACALQSLTFAPAHAPTWLQYASLADRLDHVDASEAAYLKALEIDPSLGDAHFGLGVLHLRTRRFADAAYHLRQFLTSGDADAVTWLCLGQALYHTGDFSESAEAYRQAAAFAPLAGNARRLYARAATFTAMIDGDVDGALARYPALAGPDAEPSDDLLRGAFSLFSGFGHRDAAIAVGTLRLQRDPADAVQRYLLDAVAGTPHDRAPPDYVATHFDDFALGFEQQLVGALNYRVPEELLALVASCRSRFDAMLDLGCGTGLAATGLRRLGDHLTGIDLSGKMLEVASAGGAYASLVQADAFDFLAGCKERFDLVFAADLLIYIGRLDALFEAIAGATLAGGLFAASIERVPDADFTLLPSGRFAHSEAYVERLASPHFEIMRSVRTSLRLEAGQPVEGNLYVMRRRPS